MYKNDLSTILDKNGNEIIHIGWLSSQYDFNKGRVDNSIFYLLWEHLRYKINVQRGFHKCEYCNSFFNTKNPTVKYNDEVIKVGYYSIIVFDKKERIYEAPSLIFHYIKKHQYLPPVEFIDALTNGVNSNSFRYCQLLNKYGFLK